MPDPVRIHTAGGVCGTTGVSSNLPFGPIPTIASVVPGTPALPVNPFLVEPYPRFSVALVRGEPL